ncbi:hypothetical protein DPEC_G00148640 [Dallia pectoralis]|uniref:Uncharacterized protein n=1 Tax=Dallia pectoralis TaxID=75939 RepID=A0ACC2GIF5_DALPE|nr:hypothetical protein DPEC_G00148640 [Dallia pectoralis]
MHGRDCCLGCDGLKMVTSYFPLQLYNKVLRSSSPPAVQTPPLYLDDLAQTAIYGVRTQWMASSEVSAVLKGRRNPAMPWVHSPDDLTNQRDCSQDV